MFFIFFIKKIDNVLCIFSLPRFAVYNRKLSQEMCFMLPVYYTELCTGRSKKEAGVRFFRRALYRKDTAKNKLRLSSLILLNLIEKDIVHFLLAMQAYVYYVLWKKQLVASFSKAL